MQAFEVYAPSKIPSSQLAPQTQHVKSLTYKQHAHLMSFVDIVVSNPGSCKYIICTFQVIFMVLLRYVSIPTPSCDSL